MGNRKKKQREITSCCWWNCAEEYENAMRFGIAPIKLSYLFGLHFFLLRWILLFLLSSLMSRWHCEPIHFFLFLSFFFYFLVLILHECIIRFIKWTPIFDAIERVRSREGERMCNRKPGKNREKEKYVSFATIIQYQFVYRQRNDTANDKIVYNAVFVCVKVLFKIKSRIVFCFAVMDMN